MSDMSSDVSSNSSESVKEMPEPPRKKTKMDDLLLALWLSEPNTFDAPPGIITPKTTSYKTKPKRKTMKQTLKSVMFDHTYSVPVKAKLCHGCKKAYKPLLNCDYCTMVYHPNCLNKPVTKFPVRRWMCPNHPQHFIDCVASLPSFKALCARSASPLSGMMVGENVHMQTAVMNVGTTEECSLRLDHTLCHRVSRNHAAIHVNKETYEFILINYSEFGSSVVVNGVVFELNVPQACDLAAEDRPCLTTPVVQTVPLSGNRSCRCEPRRPGLPNGASMVLQHGCLLQFGCQIFHFRIHPLKPKPVS